MTRPKENIFDTIAILEGPPDTKDDALFTRLFSWFIKSGFINEQQIADKILVSTTTIGRWSQGKNLPRHRVRAATYKFMLDTVRPRHQQ